MNVIKSTEFIQDNQEDCVAQSPHPFKTGHAIQRIYNQQLALLILPVTHPVPRFTLSLYL